MLHRVILFIYTILIHLFSPETRWILCFLDKLHRTGPEINMAFSVTFTIAAVQMLSIYYPPLSICLCLFSLVTGDHISCNMLGGDFKGKRIKLWLSPLADVQIYWVDWTVLVKARKQEKKHDNENSVCEHPGVVLAPWTRPTGRKIVSGHNVLLKSGKSQTGSICPTLGEIQEGVSTFHSSPKHLKTESQNRKSALQLGIGH